MTREEAIEFAKEQLEIFGKDSTMYEFLEFSIKALEERPKGKWTPVTERLPVHRDWYLGTFREPNTGFIGLPYICDYVGKVTRGTTKEGWILRGFTDIDNACDYHKYLECIAWQPLPEPYERGDV